MAKTIWLSMCALTLMPGAWSGPAASALRRSRERHRPPDVALRGRRARAIEVRNINGPIRIVGSDGDDGRPRGQPHHQRREPGRCLRGTAGGPTGNDRQARAGSTSAPTSSAGCRCDERLHDDRTAVDTRRPTASMSTSSCGCRATSRLRLCTVNGGDVTLDHTSGDFAVSHVERRHHAVRRARVGSRRDGERRGDGVAGRRGRQAPSSFKTVNGDVVVALPGSASLDLQPEDGERRAVHRFRDHRLAQPVVRERRGAGIRLSKPSRYAGARRPRRAGALSRDGQRGRARPQAIAGRIAHHEVPIFVRRSPDMCRRRASPAPACRCRRNRTAIGSRCRSAIHRGREP